MLRTNADSPSEQKEKCIWKETFLKWTLVQLFYIMNLSKRNLQD